MNFKQNKREALILTAALFIPGGFIALGIWKAYELYKKSKIKKDSPKPLFEELMEESDKDNETW